MFKKAKLLIATLALAFSLNASAAFASNLTWVDWQTWHAGSNGTASGTMTFGDQIVDVTMNGSFSNIIDGDYYYNNYRTGYTDPTGTYAGLMPSDVVQEVYMGHVEITFSKAITNPYIALVSVGGYNFVDYAFTSPFNVISSGPNYWGYNTYNVNGNTFSGKEYNGILQLQGTFTTLAFDINQNENWHGFNVGAPVPEPSSMLIGLMGLSGALGLKRRQKKA